MMKVVFNGDAGKTISISQCTESLRVEEVGGTVRELTLQVSDKSSTLAALQPMFKDLKIAKVEVFNGDAVVFTSGEYTEFVSLSNNISASTPSAMFITLRTA